MSTSPAASVLPASTEPRLALRDLPLDGGGVKRSECASASRAVAGAGLFVFRVLLEDGRKSARAVLAPRDDLAPLKLAEAPLQPQWEFDGSCVRVQVPLGDGQHLYGGGATGTRLLRREERVELWNLRDVAGPALPLALSVALDGSARAVVADSAARGSLQFLSDGVEFAFEREPFELWLVTGTDVATLLAQLRELLGPVVRPPLWSLGYQHLVRKPENAETVLEIAARFRARHLACDALWLDDTLLETDKPFAFHRERCAEPKALWTALHERDLQLVVAAPPRVPLGRNVGALRAGLDEGHFVLDASGSALKARTHVGLAHFPDFTREATRAWWSAQVEKFALEGVDGLWSEFDAPDLARSGWGTLAPDAQHRGTAPTRHELVHNSLGSLAASALSDGLALAHPDARPFCASRSAHFASASHSVVLGLADGAGWEALRHALPRALSAGLSGLPFFGFEIPAGAEASGELYARWHELVALLPFALGSSSSAKDLRSAWSHGGEIERAIKAALDRRMRFFPTLASLLVEAAANGLPVVRPMFLADPTDRALRSVDDQFLLGPDLVVAPVLQPGARERTVLLPSSPTGGWFLLDGGKDLLPAGRYTVEAPLGRTPIFVRAGRILITHAPARSTAAQSGSDPELQVFFDPRQRATGAFHEDLGEGEKRRTARTELSAHVLRGRVVIDAFQDGREVVDRAWHVHAHGAAAARS